MGSQAMQESLLTKLNEGAASSVGINSREYAVINSLDHQAVVGAAKSLAAKEMVTLSIVEELLWQLTAEGEEILTSGSHEAIVYRHVPEGEGEKISQAELIKVLPSAASIGLGKAIKAGWISLNAGFINRKINKIHDVIQEQLLMIKTSPADPHLDDSILKDIKKRKLANFLTEKSYVITKGPQFSTEIVKHVADLTAEMLASGEWKKLTFKKYNFQTLGTPTDGGHLHPLLKVREEFRLIFLEMGFTEMPTNNFVESSFWNFDTLFQPQQHPARDAHDTFFIKDPERATDFPPQYLEAVKRVHAEGGFGSLGYRYDWKLEEAQKNLLRTHTTAVSARMLYQLSREEVFRPVKYFSIDRVFRNEALDATHLAEFHQIEGLIADYDLSLGDLIGTLEAFFKKLGMNKLRFKPAFNPYTEPSMEVFAYHEGLKRWIEVGNSGVFRPEMLLPMGLPPKVSVIAWGLSLERPTMIKYGLNNIRDLCGHKVDLEMVNRNPICRLDKN